MVAEHYIRVRLAAGMVACLALAGCARKEYDSGETGYWPIGQDQYDRAIEDLRAFHTAKCEQELCADTVCGLGTFEPDWRRMAHETCVEAGMFYDVLLIFGDYLNMSEYNCDQGTLAIDVGCLNTVVDRSRTCDSLGSLCADGHCHSCDIITPWSILSGQSCWE